MPFDFLRRRKRPAATADDKVRASGRAPGGSTARSDGGPVAAAISSGPGIRFDGLTEDWRLTGTMRVEGRLADALNRRETLAISDVRWAPIDGSAPLVPAPGLKSIDPYDLIAVLADPETVLALGTAEKGAPRVRKEPFNVILETPPFRIVGTLLAYQGSSTGQMLEQAPEMFVPLTNAVAYLGERRVGEPDTQVILVNRLYVRGIEEQTR